MKITTNAQGKERKRLAQTIGTWLDLPVRYAGAPTFNYEVGGIIIDKDASLEFGAALPDEAADRLLQHLCNEGFDIFQFFGTNDSIDDEEEIAFTISWPRSLFTDEAIVNLRSILDSKKHLICKALGVNDIPVVVTDTASVRRVNNMKEHIRHTGICPKCGQEYTGHPALSREDGETLICPDCGTREALDTLGISLEEQDRIIQAIHRSFDHLL